MNCNEKYLITHNCSSHNIFYLLLNEEISLPSLAIINPHEHILYEFGDIIFIGSNKLLPDEYGEKSVVISKDGYTARMEKSKMVFNKSNLFDFSFEYISSKFNDENPLMKFKDILHDEYIIETDCIKDDKLNYLPNTIKKLISIGLYYLEDLYYKKEYEKIDFKNDIEKELNYKSEYASDRLDIEFINMKSNIILFLIENNAIEYENKFSKQKDLENILEEMNDKMIMTEYKSKMDIISLLATKSMCAKIYSDNNSIFEDLHLIKNTKDVKQEDEKILMLAYYKLNFLLNEENKKISWNDINDKLVLRLLSLDFYNNFTIDSVSKIIEQEITDKEFEKIKNIIDETKNEFQKQITTYFEIKIKDLVHLSNFQSVMIPSGMKMKETFRKTMKEKIGLEVIEYTDMQEELIKYAKSNHILKNNEVNVINDKKIKKSL